MRRLALTLSLGIAVITRVMMPLASQTPAQKPVFEVASVKPTPPERQNHLRLDRCTSGGRFFVGGAPLMWSLTYAFGLKDYQVFGAPDWLNEFGSAYDIEGKPATPVNEDQCRLMLQSLFADRFKLKTNFEMKEAPVYVLTIGKNGTKLHEGGSVKINGGIEYLPQTLGPRKLKWPDGLTMPTLAIILSGHTDRPVVDLTGLQGTYGVTLNFSLADGDGEPSIFTAVQDQLGLKLDPARAPIEMLVIDHIERANQN
jgi:uncharacterized protein (TIGR03435 family)